MAAMGAQAGDTIVSVLTAYPGREVYQLEGHTALRVRTPQGQDVAINYGVFDFNAPGFLYRFVKGETDYMMGVYPTWLFMREYQAEGRRVVEQELRLTSEQKRALLEAAAINYQPDHRIYRYNYVLDNCATRPLGLIEASGDTLTLRDDPRALPYDTFREAMRHYHVNYPWYQFGIDLALGSGIDYPINVRHKTFAPVALRHLLDRATLDGHPVVARTRVLLDAPEDAAVLGPTPWYLTPLCVALIILALGVWASVYEMVHRLHRVPEPPQGLWTRLYDSVLFALFGLAGCLLTFLVFVSVHEATSPNWLLLWLNPLCLLAAVAVWIRRAKRLLIWYFLLNFALILLMCILWPYAGQSANIAFIPLIVADLMRTASHIHIYYTARRHALDAKP